MERLNRNGIDAIVVHSGVECVRRTQPRHTPHPGSDET
eukprot:CAMPEP_0183332676 /NCGR_PEP_ID=MMETSP0164_2-20130417/1779_1 /TAXON_ID=221442 /ORGANISM="Coccolithus pelagicus ssp braarudi, Strain PLY182g" /LENGTH=37 /DNA_ID= /DNA_START= /DNA_END= /DNA_ORIENTATION=